MKLTYTKEAAEAAAGTGLLAIKSGMAMVLVRKIIRNRRLPKPVRGSGFLKQAPYRKVKSLKTLGIHPGQRGEAE